MNLIWLPNVQHKLNYMRLGDRAEGNLENKFFFAKYAKISLQNLELTCDRINN